MIDAMIDKLTRPGEHRRPPCQVAVTVGRRGPQGHPVDTDRFFAQEFRPTAEARVGSITVPSRRPHPSFLDDRGNPAGFPSVSGVLVHADLADAIDAGLKAYRPPQTPPTPDRRPWCSSSDGATATRWDGDGWRSISCPLEACPYYQMEREGCKPSTSIAFLLTLPDRPKMLAWWQTGSIYTTRNVMDFIKLVRGQFAGLGLPETWYGIPIRMTVGMQKRATDSGGRRFPVVSVALDGELQAAMLGVYRLREQIARLLDFRGPLALPSARDLSDEHPDTAAAELSGTPMVLPAPRAIIEARAVDHPPIALIQGVEADPDGFPACPICACEMAPARGRAGWGWLCSQRASGCRGARLWDGAIPRRP